MKQFGAIYQFELLGYLKNKIFIGVTVVMILAALIGLSFPRVVELIGFGTGGDTSEKSTVIMVLDETAMSEDSLAITESIFVSGMYGAEIRMTEVDMETLEQQVESGACDSAIVLHSGTEYTYITNDVKMYDNTEYLIQEIMQQRYQLETMLELGLSEDEANDVMCATIEGAVVVLGKNQMDNFFYTYILLFALYMAILLYGQFVATSVATEKSSRAMELLITSAKTNNLMFGKILGAGTAGLLQMVIIFGVALGAYACNQTYWEDNIFVQSMFDMPASICIYILIFFILGFAIYAFLYGAVGSMASKVEDINTSVMPVTLIFMVGFFLSIIGMTSGNIDTPLMVFASYFPFTSPMVMFIRIAMGNVRFVGIVISILILIASTIGIGILSSRIYRLGVLMYGNSPKLFKMIQLVLKKNSID